MEIKNLTNRLLDSPQMVSGKLPWNQWSSTIEDSENSIAGWLGKIFSVVAFFALLGVLLSILSPIWDGGFDGKDALGVVGMLLGIIFWAYAAFPVTQVIRNTGDGVASSKSGVVRLMFLDLPVALMKMAGYLLAMIGLFAAIASLIGFLTTLNLGGDMMGMVSSGLGSFTNMGTAVLSSVLADTPLSMISEMMGDLMQQPEMLSNAGGSAWTVAGAMGVFSAFVSVVFVLVSMYINVAIYQFLFGLVAALVNWVKGPYLPFKSL